MALLWIFVTISLWGCAAFSKVLMVILQWLRAVLGSPWANSSHGLGQGRQFVLAAKGETQEESRSHTHQQRGSLSTRDQLLEVCSQRSPEPSQASLGSTKDQPLEVCIQLSRNIVNRNARLSWEWISSLGWSYTAGWREAGYNLIALYTAFEKCIVWKVIISCSKHPEKEMRLAIVEKWAYIQLFLGDWLILYNHLESWIFYAIKRSK